MAKQKEKYLMGDTIPVDTEFWYFNIKFRVVPRRTCEGCYFRGHSEDGKEICYKTELEEKWCKLLDIDEITRFGNCSMSQRQDHTSVIYRVINHLYD